MIYAGMTFTALSFWTIFFFGIHALLGNDVHVDTGAPSYLLFTVARWFLGLLIIMAYHPIIRIIYMSWDEWKSFLTAIVGVLVALLAVVYCIKYMSGN